MHHVAEEVHCGYTEVQIDQSYVFQFSMNYFIYKMGNISDCHLNLVHPSQCTYAVFYPVNVCVM